MRMHWIGVVVVAAAALPAQDGRASSHREAPFITRMPKVDNTDFYMFRGYEGVAADGTGGRSGFVTLIANFQPLQDAYGGPNYFTMDPEAIYEIHVENTGDAVEDITFQFDFDSALANSGGGFALDVGPNGNTKSVAIPLTAIGGISTLTDPEQNVIETYTIKIIRG